MSDMLIPSIVSAVTNTECEALGELARDKVVLEVGSDYGKSTIAMASVARRVVSCDFFVDYFTQIRHTDVLPVFFENLHKYKVWPKVTHIVGDFSSVSRQLAPHQFDLIFIDAVHEQEYIRRDIWNAIGLLRVPGVLAFHDYVNQNSPEGTPYNMIPSIDAFTNAFGLGIRVIGTLAIVDIPQFIQHHEYES